MLQEIRRGLCGVPLERGSAIQSRGYRGATCQRVRSVGRSNTALSCEARLNEDGARSAATNRLSRFVSFSALLAGLLTPVHFCEEDELPPHPPQPP